MSLLAHLWHINEFGSTKRGGAMNSASKCYMEFSKGLFLYNRTMYFGMPISNVKKKEREREESWDECKAFIILFFFLLKGLVFINILLMAKSLNI